jgi:hypothetical protein
VAGGEEGQQWGPHRGGGAAGGGGRAGRRKWDGTERVRMDGGGGKGRVGDMAKPQRTAGSDPLVPGAHAFLSL